MRNERAWLKDAIFYEIYPQSFCDTNADGIGDIQGIISKLDYIQSVGCNALWLNPCFDSPFVDAGYDIRDYYRVAPRYGTNADLKALFDECRKRGMHVLLDLVPGHTSVECKWFKESQKLERNEYTDRYVWTNSVWEGFEGVGNIMGCIRGGTEREGCCAVNFYNCQPALNFGFYKKTKPWQQGIDDEGPRATREAIKDVMRFWLSLGADGFRVDMAHSLVKNDEDHKGTVALWHNFFDFLDKEFPAAVMVSEWGEADKSLEAGFQMDFLLHFGPSHYLELFRKENESNIRPEDSKIHPYFSRKGGGDIKDFFDVYIKNRASTVGKGGLICFPSGNHDMIRMARTLDAEEMKIAFAFILTMPGVPFIYYGDEIGMKYVENIKSVEGGYVRTGSRSPMAFDKSANAGFSAAPAEELYIAQDESKSYINAESESADENSLLSEVRRLVALRKAHSAFASDADITLLQCDKDAYPFVYERKSADETIFAVFNPCDKDAVVTAKIPESARVIYAVGSKEPLKKENGSLIVSGASAVFLK